MHVVHMILIKRTSYLVIAYPIFINLHLLKKKKTLRPIWTCFTLWRPNSLRKKKMPVRIAVLFSICVNYLCARYCIFRNDQISDLKIGLRQERYSSKKLYRSELSTSTCFLFPQFIDVVIEGRRSSVEAIIQTFPEYLDERNSVSWKMARRGTAHHIF